MLAGNCSSSYTVRREQHQNINDQKNCHPVENIQKSGKCIILVRHGETEWNRLHRFQGRSDLALNSKGNKQAHALALALKNETISSIYSSPLQRAIETARHIRRFHPATPFIQEPALMEMDLGDFEGMEAKQWAEQYQDFRRTWEKNPANLTMPGGESLEKVQLRAVDALKRISTSIPPDSTSLLCTHNFVIVSLLCFASNTPLNQFREMKQDTAALNIISVNGSDFQVVTINDNSHLRHL